jgi:hypothetical protein
MLDFIHYQFFSTVHILDAKIVFLMLGVDLFVQYMRLNMGINAGLLVALEPVRKGLELAKRMLLSGEKIKVSGVNQHSMDCGVFFELELNSHGRELQITTQLSHMMLLIQRSNNGKTISVQIGGIVARQCAHHVEWSLHGPNLPNQNHQQIFWIG